ncbi:MAG: glycosyltransferase family 4 protein, partial [Paludibacteraceae bacterium]
MHKLKIAYISRRMFSDVDLSFLMEAKDMAEMDYYVPIFKNYYQGAAFNIQKPSPKFGIYLATELYPELTPCSRLIDANRFFVVNSFAIHAWQPYNLWLYVKFVWRLRKYDVIHITDFPQYFEIPLYFLRKKIVLTVHDPIPHSTEKCNAPLVLKARKWGFRLLHHFIILNTAQKAECVALNHLEKKHIYDSRLGRYDYLRMYERKNTKTGNYFLFFGQIASNKGIDYLLEAMKLVHKQYPQIRLIVAGKGEYPFDISEYQQLGYIEFRNRFIPDEELATLIQGAYCAVCPYKDATQSGVVMSAFAFNKPIIATNVGGLPEQVEHDKYGLIVPPCDVEALAQAMIHLLSHPEKLQEYADNIESDYAEGPKSWKEIAKGL